MGGAIKSGASVMWGAGYVLKEKGKRQRCSHIAVSWRNGVLCWDDGVMGQGETIIVRDTKGCFLEHSRVFTGSVGSAPFINS